MLRPDSRGGYHDPARLPQQVGAYPHPCAPLRGQVPVEAAVDQAEHRHDHQGEDDEIHRKDRVGYERVERLVGELELEATAPDDGLDDLFGGGQSDDNDAQQTGLIQALKNPAQRVQAREAIGEVLETERQVKKDVKKAGYLLDQCAKANSYLTAAAKEGLRPESKLTGVAKQLDQIETRVAAIRAYLAKHA